MKKPVWIIILILTISMVLSLFQDAADRQMHQAKHRQKLRMPIRRNSG